MGQHFYTYPAVVELRAGSQPARLRALEVEHQQTIEDRSDRPGPVSRPPGGTGRPDEPEIPPLSARLRRVGSRGPGPAM